jgi:hypothetical protein
MFTFFLLDLILLDRRSGPGRAPLHSWRPRTERRVYRVVRMRRTPAAISGSLPENLQSARTARSEGLNIGQFAIAKTGRVR